MPNEQIEADDEGAIDNTQRNETQHAKDQRIKRK